MTAKLDDLRAYLLAPENTLILFPIRKNHRDGFDPEEAITVTADVTELLSYAAKLLHDLQDREKRIARLEAENETLTEGFKSIDSSLGSAMDHVDQDAKRISALEAENARLRAEVGFVERLRAMEPKP